MYENSKIGGLPVSIFFSSPFPSNFTISLFALLTSDRVGGGGGGGGKVGGLREVVKKQLENQCKLYLFTNSVTVAQVQ